MKLSHSFSRQLYRKAGLFLIYAIGLTIVMLQIRSIS